MSGHSKWATTKRAKAVTDAKRASVFTKLTKAVALAARDGADPTHNFKLRLAVDQARGASVPKDNIERAIKRGSGADTAGAALEELTYECFGPHGSAFIVEVVTDNRNRAAADIKHIFSAVGGSLGATNSGLWMFDRVGGIKAVAPSGQSQEVIELAAIDAGAADIQWLDDHTLWITTPPTDLPTVKTRLEQLNFTITDSEAGYHAKETLPVTDTMRPALEKLYDALDDAEDVQNFWSNMAV
ncbi:MAG: YebC/PmpR family DNA-binding transcriptional regulator [Patescibacteria group bacterium]